MDQPEDSPVISGSGLTTVFLDSGSILRRDADGYAFGTSLELGSGGGGISVAEGFTLVWDSPITGDGDFTKEGDGTLSFPATAAVSYSGTTSVKAGILDVLYIPYDCHLQRQQRSAFAVILIPNQFGTRPETVTVPEAVTEPDPGTILVTEPVPNTNQLFPPTIKP